MTTDRSMGQKKGYSRRRLRYSGTRNHERAKWMKKVNASGEKIIKALRQFNIEARLAEILVGPTVIQFRILACPGIKSQQRSPSAKRQRSPWRSQASGSGSDNRQSPTVGIEIPNPRRRGIPIRTIITDPAYQDTDTTLPLPFRGRVSGDSVIIGSRICRICLLQGPRAPERTYYQSCIVGLCS